MLHQTRTEDSELTTALGMPSLLCLQRHNQWHPVITYLRFSSEVIKAWITLLPFVTFLKLNAFNYLLAAQHELPPLSSSPAAPPHRRDRGILTGEPTSARADSPVRESSPGALGTVGWHLLFSSSTDLERCCLLHMVARCQVPSWWVQSQPLHWAALTKPHSSLKPKELCQFTPAEATIYYFYFLNMR